MVNHLMPKRNNLIPIMNHLVPVRKHLLFIMNHLVPLMNHVVHVVPIMTHILCMMIHLLPMMNQLEFIINHLVAITWCVEVTLKLWGLSFSSQCLESGNRLLWCEPTAGCKRDGLKYILELNHAALIKKKKRLTRSWGNGFENKIHCQLFWNLCFCPFLFLFLLCQLLAAAEIWPTPRSRLLRKTYICIFV